ncbi:efflux RND transporter permease subunit [Bacillus sp. FJAT-49732]|uniref:Efflux RND transporter permease subunit n=1 Tax=Lederbergia citrisecunda TaxID=2833583 RepID=A0A942YJM0_9BACI|nr:efflux RND transporter permease subunit [Lederbergia citrisecunda]MBS4198737.1 efflux RND transporter permease subunit [Lederbergia citrisecunda]
MNLSNFSIKRPVFTIVTMFLVIILGIVSLLKIPLKLIPEINPPVAVVVTSYQGASPVEVVEKITKPLEASLATLPGIKNIQSVSREGSNLILLEFSWSTSIDDIQNDVLQRIDQTPIPSDAGKPRFLKFDPSQFPVIQLSLKTDKDEKSLRNLTDKLTTELSKVKGVASVNVTGKLIEEINVTIHQDDLKKYSLSQADVVSIIQANNISTPGDTVLTEGKELTTRIMSMVHSADEIANLVITVNPLNGEKIRIKDVAMVKQQEQISESITRTNEKPSVLLNVLQESDANTAEVSKDFQKELKTLLKKDQYKGIESDILFDQGDYVRIAIGNIANSLIIGGALAMLVLFFFLRNIKSPLIIGIAIPYSVIVTFVLMFFADFALNIMTLGALALGIGMLVDNAIVVIENIYRHLSMGKEPKQAALEGAKEVAGAITASTLTTVAVFLPVVFISGLLGQLFKEFAFTISFSLFASLFVALTVIPMLASRFLKKRHGDYEAIRRRSKPMNMLDQSIRWSLRHRFFVLFIAIVLFVGGLFGMTTVGMQFLPPTDEGFFSVNVKLENGAALSETEKFISIIENELKKEKDVDVYVSLIGSTQESTFQGGGSANSAEVYVKLIPLADRNRSLFEIVDDIKPKIEKEVGKVNKEANIRFNVQAASGMAPQTLTFNVTDTNKKRLEDSTDKIFNALKDLENVSDLSTTIANTVEEVHISIDRDKAFEAGLTPVQIAMIFNDATRGVQASQIITEDKEVYGIFVEYEESITRDVDNLKSLLIRRPDGSYGNLGDFAKIEIGTGPVEIQRINQLDSVEFTLKYSTETNLGTMSKEVESEIASLHLPSDTEITYSGEKELLEDSIDDMIMAFILAIILIYIVMAAQFESFKYPFVIMFTVPLMVIGVAIALVTAHMPISVPAFIGIIILAGIVVNNAIVIVDYINQRKQAGLSSYDSLVESVKDRARPILMTALTTILGLVPLALGIGEGTEMNQPMGVTVIGGLISSTFLTLFVIPVVYSLFDPETRRMNRKRIRWKKEHS